jgi:hypothetical protein
MYETSFAVLFLAFAWAPSAAAQILGDAPDKGAAEQVGTDCGTFARVAKTFLNNRGLKVAQSYAKVDEDWASGPGYRCIVFRNASPRAVEGKALSRDDVVRDYLKDRSKADFRWKNLSRGYWAAPDHNFWMGASLQLKEERTGCFAKLFMSFSLGGTVLLGIIPYDLYTWPVPPDNGRLQIEYMAEIVKELPH